MPLASNRALEALVRANDDEASWQVLEDWLLETNDPRAKLVRLEKAGEDTTAAEAELAPLLFGSARLARVVYAQQWRAGYARIASATLPSSVLAYELRDAPALALVRELYLRAGERTFLSAAAVSGELELERLTLHYSGRRPCTLGAFPVVPSLALGGERLSVDYTPSPVRELDLALSPRATAELLRPDRFEELRTLTVRTGSLLYPWTGVFDALLERTCAPRLEALRLDAAPSIEFLRDVATSPLAQRLETLSFAGADCEMDALRRLGRSAGERVDGLFRAPPNLDL